MKRSHEERIYLSKKAHTSRKTNKPRRNEFALHKTKKHYQEEIIEKFLEKEIDEELR